jgi:hypothetical protein
MKQRVAWQLVGVAAVLLAGSGASRAAVQVKDRVYWLGISDWQLCPTAGGVYLVASQWHQSDRYRGDKSRQWYVSAPTIKAANGKFLASDPAGRNPTVHLVTKKGANTRWVFELQTRFSPGPAKEEFRSTLKEGPSGFTFRVKVAEGPFKGWYLAAGKPTKRKGEKTAVRPLKLVRGVKNATVFSYIEANYFVEHK